MIVLHSKNFNRRYLSPVHSTIGFSWDRIICYLKNKSVGMIQIYC